MLALPLIIAWAAAVGPLATTTGPAVPAVDREMRQARTISGTVVDSVSGEPLSTGQVLVVGTTIGTAVRADGKFTLEVPLRAVTLQIRSIGHKPRTVDVPANQNAVTIALERDNFRLQEVVVSGQATGIEKKNLATAISTVSADELAQVPTPSIERDLEGKVPGAHISENSGAPGGGSIVRMRGVTTIIGAFQPMYVIDGVIVSNVQLATGTNAFTTANGNTLAPQTENQDNGANRIADINPYDIETVEVLKGAAASAIYGSKASNGVIILTTKRGQAGATQFTVTQRVGMSQLSHKYGVRCFHSAAEAASVFGDLALTSWTPNCYDIEQQLYGQAAPSTETSLGMRGGTGATRYFASFLDGHDGGIMPNSSADKKSLRVNVDQNIGSKAVLSIGSELVISQRNPQITQNENNGLSITSAPAYGVSWLDLRRQADGTYPHDPFNQNNPFQTAALFVNREDVNRGIVSARLQWELYTTDRQSLKLSVNGGGDAFTQQNKVIEPPELYATQGQGLPGSSLVGNAVNQNTNLNTNLVHKYQLPGGGTATSQVGMELESVDLNQSYTLSQGLIGGLTNINDGLAVRVQQLRQRVRDQGFFAQEEVLLMNEKLLLTAGMRADRSTNNANSDKLFYYPKASVSYRMPNLTSLIDELKLRLAMGESGNQPQYGQKFTELNTSNLGGVVPTSTIGGSAGAPDLRPERQREIETGFDATVLHSRVNVEATVYEKDISDLLLQRTLVPSTGLSELTFNGGQMRTRGLELAATIIAVQRAQWNWTTRGTLSGDRCIIMSLPVPAFVPAQFIGDRKHGEGFIEPGKSCTQIIGNDTLGSEPGDAKLGPLGTEVLRQTGDAAPRYNWSWSNDVRWKDFSLSFLFDGQKGGTMVNLTQRLYDASGTSPDQVTPLHPGWLTGDQRYALSNKTDRIMDQDVSYVKLREVTLSYTIPRQFVDRWGVGAHSARISLSGRNLLTFTNYQSTGDPEANQVSKSMAGGIPWDLWAYPPSRTYWLTVNLGF
jgi:TonB-linked SusC/RagA family outer membrane protein